MKIFTISLVVISCISVFISCASTEFKPYEAKTNLFEGTGGTKSIVDEIEFWDNGDPPRKFMILGIIEDERPGGAIPMSGLKIDIARKTKEVGGDAVIILGNKSNVVGYIGQGYSNTSTFGSYSSTRSTAFAVPARRNFSKYAVIKYLD